MKRKTAMKKLMGTGLSRNEAADVPSFYHLFGLNNQEAVSHEEMFRIMSLRNALNELTQIFSSVASAFNDFCSTCRTLATF